MKEIIRKKTLHTETSLKEEFVLSNGLGGYASGSVLGSLERKHHAYFVASMNPPIERRVFLGKIEEEIHIGKEIYSLASSNDVGGRITSPFLSSFLLKYHPIYVYENEQFKVQKSFAVKPLENVFALTYEIESFFKEITFSYTPFFASRDHGDVSHINSLPKEFQVNENQIQFAYSDHQVFFSFSKGKVVASEEKVTNEIIYAIDEATGDMRRDRYATPYHIDIDLKPHQKVTVEILCYLDENPKTKASLVIKEYDDYNQNLIESSTMLIKNKEFLEQFEELSYAAEKFVVYRKSTDAKTILAGFPWFTDWGRDSMIAMEGLMLVTGRFVEAKSLLKSFATYEKKGLIPNMFPDGGSAPLYNTVDASLWFIHSVYVYYQYTKDRELVDELLPTMKNIIHYYQEGTDFNIGMDDDGLIHAGSDLDQVTWMDVRINGEVVTPRHGKPVEINALWYNALLIMDFFIQNEFSYIVLANKARRSFVRKFWNEKKNCLFDVADPMDDSVRPNQIYALSLPFPVLDESFADDIFQAVETELLELHGLRSLSIKDERFIPNYQGDIMSRDHAYHMGTSWGFLLGTYLVTKLRYRPSAREEIVSVMNQALGELNQGCLFGYAEVFDGLNGDFGKGCYSQAWSVGEFLRLVYELMK